MEDRNTRDLCLMQRIAEGDREAFRELFDLCAPSVLGMLVRIVRNRGMAEEILQEVFLQVWRHSSSSPDEAPPLAWMLRLARSRAVDHIRRRQADRLIRDRAIAALEHLEQGFGLFSAA